MAAGLGDFTGIGEKLMPETGTPLEKIFIVKGDITRLSVDAIVNAANSSLLGGGGVDGAIHRAAGPELLEECRKLGGCPTGEARITRGYGLPARYVIHTVGPVWRDGKHGEYDLLASCYRNVLRLALQYDLNTVAFPAISTGAYRFPPARAAEIALRETVKFINRHSAIKKIFFVCFSPAIFQAYKNALKQYAKSQV